MNSAHYPSLDLCKKLHSIGMRGIGEYGYSEWQGVNGVGDEHTKTEFTSKESFYDLGKRREEGGKWVSLSWIFIEAYSVMEMLDYIRKNNVSILGINFLSPELPDALAESIISSFK